MFRQYLQVKERYKDCIVFFRMGDFYEMFFEDAEIASRILGITLTSRGEYGGKKVPMAGVPYHSAKPYLGKLLAQGYKVAICEQLEDPKLAKGLVKRDVIRVVTPGSVVDEGILEDSKNLFIASIWGVEPEIGLAHVDLSTGLFMVSQISNKSHVKEELQRLSPAEVLLPDSLLKEWEEALRPYRVEVLDPIQYHPDQAQDVLKEHFRVRSLKGLGIEHLFSAVCASAALLKYLSLTQKTHLDHITDLRFYNLSQFMILDPTCLRDLEIIRNPRTNTEEDTLVSVMDKAQTPMGKRLLRQWIIRPLLDPNAIESRLDAVEGLVQKRQLKKRLRELLTKMPDLERINARVAMARASPRDLIALKEGLKNVPRLKEALGEIPLKGLLTHILDRLDPIGEVLELVEKAISEDAPSLPKEMGIIKEGFNLELDRLIGIMRDGRNWIAGFVKTEQERTGIPNLRVGYNKVFGYYIEVTRSYLHLVPKDYVRKQTLANAERFINQELKEREEQVLTAEERRIELEAQLFGEVQKEVARHSKRIASLAGAIGELDVVLGLAELASENRYVRPTIVEEPIVDIREGRHPVLEKKLGLEPFVPNDLSLDGSKKQILIITGPNMAGKSTILRQTALITLMAQVGSFVPASTATIGIVDRIFTRIGASDDIAKGQSTFMVEMAETANILRNATPKSLVILDEVGRGTSTYDGMSIAWAVVEALHSLEGKGVRTLFATHYHELTELGTLLPRVKIYTMDVKEWGDSVVFLRTLRPGAADRSYGIEVARIAGVPESVLKRAKEILFGLEKQRADTKIRGKPITRDTGSKFQPPLFSVADQRLISWIKNLDLNKITPIEALLELKKLQEHVLQLQPTKGK